MNRRQIFPQLVAVVLALTLFASIGSPALAAAETEIVNIRVPVEPFQVYVPCAAGGAGETLDLTGPLHIVLELTFDSAGGFHSLSHFQPQGVIGVGSTTGDIYRATGLTEDRVDGKVGFTETLINNFRMIGPGPGNNFLIHETFHMTVAATGEVTAFVDNFQVECK